MEDVADDDDVCAVEAGAGGGRSIVAERRRVVTTQGHCVKECLRRMLVGAVACVEDRQVHPAGVRETVCGTR